MNHHRLRNIFIAFAVLCMAAATGASAYAIPYFP